MFAAGVLLAGLGGRQGLSGFASAAVAGATGGVQAAEVMSNGDIAEASVEEDVTAAGQGEGVSGVGEGMRKARARVSSDVRTRFPVTVVDEQPERMVVIGDVHGDVGEGYMDTL